MRSILFPIVLPVALVAASAGADTLPQGLTCGLSYENEELTGVFNSCQGVSTFGNSHSVGAHAPGYVGVLDMDNGLSDPFASVGFAHQELCAPNTPSCGNSGATVAVFGDDSTHFVLPQGAVCGFHHTFYSPGRTCMGYNPTLAFPGIASDNQGVPGCPPGWTPHHGFDMNSGSQYWTWCSYDDPNNMSLTGGATLPIAAIGVACGAVHNDAANHEGNTLCMGYYPARGSGQALCPSGAGTSAFFDDGEPSGIGVGLCTLNTNSFPVPAMPYGTLDTRNSSDGTFGGWAYDANSPATSIAIHVYVDGPAGSGAFAGQFIANGSRPDVNSAFGITGNHGFNFALPAQYLGDGFSHSVYVYAIALFGQGNPQVAGSPGSFVPAGSCRPGTVDCCGDGVCRSSCRNVFCN